MIMDKPINCFPGYEFKFIDGAEGKQNMYRGTNLGFGGYVYYEEGIYSNVALLDVQSLHPHSIIALNKFGKYTKRYEDILKARIAIKNHDYDTAGKMLDGAFKKYLTSDEEADKLATALKLVLNSTFGYGFASFENPFVDSRDKNNIVALRGSLFMRTLQDEVKKRGFNICHIKTDSCKVPNATPEIINFIMEFAKQYNYSFTHEATYDRLCLVNGSTYIAKYADNAWCEKQYGYVPVDNLKAAKKGKKWTATAKQFQVPFVFKTLFSKEPIEFKDLCQTFEVKTAIHIDMHEIVSPEVDDYNRKIGLCNDRITAILNTNPDLSPKSPQRLEIKTIEKEEKRLKVERDLLLEQLGGRDLHFVGKVGNFCPIKPGRGGGILVREGKDGDGNIKYDAVTGTLKPDKTPYRWLEAEAVKALGKEDDIDKSYYRKMVDDAIKAISKYGDFERFVADEPYASIDPAELEFPVEDDLPWYIGPELEKALEQTRADTSDNFNKR